MLDLPPSLLFPLCSAFEDEDEGDEDNVFFAVETSGVLLGAPSVISLVDFDSAVGVSR